jgi:hypothetical protein
MNKLILSALFIWAISSCLPLKKSDTLTLNKSELTGLISIIDSNLKSNPNLNYHVLYADIFNDSTIVIEICHNQILAYQKLGICESFKLEHSNVFIYDPKLCRNSNIADSLISKQGQHPFYIPDNSYWSILVTRRNGQIAFSEIKLLPSYLNLDVNKVEDFDF